jgi:hypothetical protein
MTKKKKKNKEQEFFFFFFFLCCKKKTNLCRNKSEEQLRDKENFFKNKYASF